MLAGGHAAGHVTLGPWYTAPMMLTVDPWHWLTKDGEFLFDNPRLYRRMLRIARFIEYGGQLQKNETRETLIECKRRPKGKPCPGLMWVVKTGDDGILSRRYWKA